MWCEKEVYVVVETCCSIGAFFHKELVIWQYIPPYTTFFILPAVASAKYIYRTAGNFFLEMALCMYFWSLLTSVGR